MRCHSFERLDTGRCRKQRCSPRHRVIYISNVLILPTALWILRFKRNIFFSPFPSLDLCFLSAVTRTSRSSLRRKPREGEATGELLLSAANPRREVPLLFSPTHPSSHSPFPLPLFSDSLPLLLIMLIHRMFSTLQVYCDLFRGETSSFDPFFHYERIRLR